MRKSVVAGLFVSLLLASIPVAGAATGTLPGGTAISVEIQSPAEGGLAPSDGATLTGSASVGMGSAAKDTSLVYILDVSGSTANDSGVNCDGAPGSDSILTCEKEAVRRVNADAAMAGSPVLNSGLGVFNNGGAVIQGLTSPGGPIEAALGSLPAANGGTNFGAGLMTAKSILMSGSAATNKVVVFLTDGDGSGSSALPSGTVVKAFAIAGAGCSSNLEAISDTCTVVDDLADLDDVIGEAIGASIDSLTYSVDGGASVVLSTEPPAPQLGPVTVEFDEPLPTLAFGTHDVCVTVNGTDGEGSGSATTCSTFEVVQNMVDCSIPGVVCMATANDGNSSTATVVGTPSFNKALGIRPADAGPGDCPSNDCFTGYDVLFSGTGGVGVVEMTVLAASKATSTPPGLAAVYIDGVELTAKCNMKDASKSPIPCAKITKGKGGLTQYFVRFDADPGFHFK